MPKVDSAGKLRLPEIGAILPYYGCKRALAPVIVGQLGKHSTYWEPFCGSLAVLFAKPKSRQETVNDLHEDAINLARVLQNEEWCTWLYRKLYLTPTAETFYQEALTSIDWRADCPANGRTDEEKAKRAYYYFVRSWLGRNGFTGLAKEPDGFCVRYTSGGGCPGKRFTAAVDSIPDWHDRLRRVVILNRDGLDLLERIADEPGTAIYCDPPYLAKTARYKHDWSMVEHQRLATLCGQYKKARVVVSYYADPQLAGFYPAANGWSVIACSRLKNLDASTGTGRAGGTAPEVLLVNGEVYK